jgi:hypothetical protein
LEDREEDGDKYYDEPLGDMRIESEEDRLGITSNGRLCFSSLGEFQDMLRQVYGRTGNCVINKFIAMSAFWFVTPCSSVGGKQNFLRNAQPQVSLLRHVLLYCRDSSVGIATSYGLDDRGVRVRVPVGSRIFCFPNRPDRL